LNLGPTPATVVSDANGHKGTVIVSTSGEHEGDVIDLGIHLDANEGLLIELDAGAAVASIGRETASTNE
jgi:hypothetical protein